jgi:hypothetical protein
MNSDDPAQRSALLLESVHATILRTQILIERTRAAQLATRQSLDEASARKTAALLPRDPHITG